MTLEALTIAIRAALYFSLLPLFGVAAFGLYGLRDTDRSAEMLPLRGWVVTMALIGLVASAIQIVVMAASMAGISLWAVDRVILGQLITETPIGTAWNVRVILLVAILLALPLFPRRPTAVLILVTVLAGIAADSLAWAGHGAMDEATVGWVHLVADLIHLLAAGAWMGAILSLGWLLFSRKVAVDSNRLTLLHRALDSFASTGTIVVALILGTGIVNGWILVGPRNIWLLPADPYGRLLLIKIALFAVMLGLASANRFKLTPALGVAATSNQSLAALRRSLVIEGGCALLIFAIVAWLGTLAPTKDKSLPQAGLQWLRPAI